MLRIKEIAKRKEITLEQLANKLNINRVTLSRSINGNPTIETLNKIANVLDVEVVELFVPAKNNKTETIYVNREGSFVPVGELKI